MKHLDYLKAHSWEALAEATHYVESLRDSGAKWFEAFEVYCLGKADDIYYTLEEMRPHVFAVFSELSGIYYDAKGYEDPRDYHRYE